MIMMLFWGQILFSKTLEYHQEFAFIHNYRKGGRNYMEQWNIVRKSRILSFSATCLTIFINLCYNTRCVNVHLLVPLACLQNQEIEIWYTIIKSLVLSHYICWLKIDIYITQMWHVLLQIYFTFQLCLLTILFI